MSARRVVLLSQRFWPLSGGPEHAMRLLADALAEQGHAVTVLTGRWSARWPSEVDYNGVRIVRLPQPAARGWAAWRYAGRVRRWLVQHREQIDAVCVSQLRYDAYAAVAATRHLGVPLVLRCDEVGPCGDACWQRQTWSGRWIKRRCRQAPAIVVSSELAQNELLSAGYRRASIHLIAPGVPRATEHTPAGRMTARESLATAHAALGLARDTPLVVHAGNLHDEENLAELVACWPAVRAAHPQARLWLTGEGTGRKPLEEQISRLGLGGHVLLPGVFDSLSELFAAADLFIQPACRDLAPLMLIEAMAHGLPCVLGNLQVQQCLKFDENCALIVPEMNTAALAAAIVRLLGNPGTAASLGRAAQEHVRRSFPLDKMVNQHLQLFDALQA